MAAVERDNDLAAEHPRELMTLVRPDAHDQVGRRISSSFPSDLFEQARGLAEIDVSNPWSEERCREWWETHKPAPALP